MSTTRRHLLLLITALMLSACSTAPVLEQQTVWEMLGRIKIKHQDKVDTANIRWQQADDQYQVDLSGPLGQGAIRVIGTPENAKLYQGGELLGEANDADTLFFHYTHIKLPVSSLQYWLRGKVDPKRPHRWLATAERAPKTLLQDGWRIEFSQFRDTTLNAAPPSSVPYRLHATRESSSALLIIKQWK